MTTTAPTLTTTRSPLLDGPGDLTTEARLRVGLITASIRDGRMGTAITDWVADTLTTRQEMIVDALDLAEIELPDDRYLVPGGAEHRSSVADAIAASDAFVFVTPEYNHSYPAPLKRFIDWHYHEWMFKPAMIVAYGAQGGYAAIEHLRGVLAELHVVTTRRSVAVSAPWEALDEDGRLAPGGSLVRGLDGAMNELDWWARTLATARAENPFTD